MKTYFKFPSLVICSLLVVLGMNMGCKKQALNYTTTSTLNIVDYLRQDPKFTEFVKMLDSTNISSYLNAYGAYTCFAPTNDAIKLYLAQIGKKSVYDIDTASLRNIIRLHLIQDTLSTPSFIDGKMSSPTMYGQYLVTGTGVTDGVSSILVNRQASILQSNILTGNGYIHVIDHVLQPATLTLAKTIEANSRYSIFTQALKATGLYDTLNIANNPDTTRRWITFVAESDSVLKIAHINSYSDLYKKYCLTGNPKNPSDSLYLYMAYHILPGLKYMTDIISSPSHATLVPTQIITAELDGQAIILNQATFNGIFEAGVLMNRPNSDNSCTNGVLHELAGDIYLKIRSPFRVDMDLGDQPEIRKMTSIFRIAGKSVNLNYGQLANVTWGVSSATITYSVEAANGSNFYYWNDLITVTLRTAASTNPYIEFTTPLIVAGKYKVWLDYRKGNGKYIQASVDGVALSRIIDMTGYLPSTTATDDVLESQGYKRYSSSAPASNSTQMGQLAGVVTITSTDKHKIRLTCIKDGGKGDATIDMIQFIPIDADQQYPRFGKDGSLMARP